MRILTVTLGYPKEPGDSTAPFIAAMADGLAARGHHVDVVLPYHPGFRQRDGAGIRFFPYRYSPLPGYAPWGFGQTFGSRSRVRPAAAVLLPFVLASLRQCLSRRLAKESYDVVHAHWVLPNGLIATPVAHAHDVPVVVTLHGTDVAMAERHRLLGRLATRTFESVDAITTTSEHLRQRAIALGASPERATTVYIGVDTVKFAPSAPDPDLRAQFGASENTFLIVAVGRLAEVKGFEHLITAAGSIDGAAVAVIGDGELREELELRARALGGRVRLIGNVPHDRVAQAMAAADAVVVPSVVDRAGRVDATTSTALEAMACGRPLVATSVGGIPEIVTNGDNGLLVPAKDPQALAEALVRLRDDVVLRRELGTRARQFALDRLDWGRTAEGLEAAFESARLHIAKSGHPPRRR
jgi:glycosyltransferase involved in cell wall biosynthesis